MIHSEVIRELEQAVGAVNVSADPNDLIAYSYDSQPFWWRTSQAL